MNNLSHSPLLEDDGMGSRGGGGEVGRGRGGSNQNRYYHKFYVLIQEINRRGCLPWQTTTMPMDNIRFGVVSGDGGIDDGDGPPPFPLLLCSEFLAVIAATVCTVPLR